MKKISLLIISFIIVFTISGCENSKTSDMKIAALNGPTGIGMVQLMDDYNIEILQSPTDVASKILNGDCDIATLPSNLAAVLYQKSGHEIIEISTVALGNLYIVGNDLKNISYDSIKDKTIIASGKGGTPEYILKKLFPNTKVKWGSSHADVVQEMLKTKGSVAMLPEPFVSVALSKGDNASVLFDMNQRWKDKTGKELPMGVLVATKEFATEHSGELEAFLEDYSKSVEYVNNSSESAELLAEKGFFDNEKVARKAIPGCKIVFDKDNKMLRTFYEILYKIDPKALGGSIPDEEFYY